MSSGHNEPRLLYAIQGIQAYHIENGREVSLTPAGPQTLSLLMVPTSSPFADLSTADSSSAAPEEDFYLHLHLPPELDLPLPATTQLYHQPPRSYLIPRWDLGPESGAFTRIEFPKLSEGKVTQEDVDTFETILAQCTAFLERAAPPVTAKTSSGKAALSGSSSGTATPSSSKKGYADSELPAYDPGSFKPGEGYAAGSSSSQLGGQIVLVDEENGSVVGELGEGFTVVEDKIQSGSKDPVQITLPSDGSNNISVTPASPEYLAKMMHPAYQKSSLVSSAAAASRLIVTTSGQISNMLNSGADTFTHKTKPAASPLTFKPTTHAHVRRVHTFSENVAGLSAKTVGSIGHYAQNLGASLAGRSAKKGGKGYGPDGQPLDSFKPGLLNKSIMAFSTIADGIDQAGRNLLNSGSAAATTMVSHKWGEEAGSISRSLTGGVKNVGLVYIDATGVSRRAVITSVAKGMVVGRVKGGGDLVVGGGDGGQIVSSNPQASASTTSFASQQPLLGGGEGRMTPDTSLMSGGRDTPIGFGRAETVPSGYGNGRNDHSGVGESLNGQPAYRY